MTRKAAFAFLFVAILSLAGCSGTIENLGQSSTVSAVNLSCSPAGVQTSQTSQCNAAVSGTGDVSQTVAWSALAGKISSTGLYTAPTSMPSSGSDTITATSTQDSSKYTKTTLSISPNAVQATVTKVSVSAVPSSITTAQTATCTAAVTGTGSYSTAVTWTATGGTITQAGVLTPSGAGTATCTANSAQSGYTNISGSAGIPVTAVSSSAPATVTSINVVATPSSITTAQTSTCQATVAGTGSFSNAVTWTATGGTITPAGIFTPSVAGTGSCIAHSAQAGYTNLTGAASIAIAATPFSITSISVQAAPASITSAQTTACSDTVSGTGAFSKAVTWSASGGTISSSGVFTPAGAGAATCTATSSVLGFLNISGTASIAVSTAAPAVSLVSLVCTPSSLTTAQTATCTPTITGTGAFTNTVNLTISPVAGGSLSSSTNVSSGTAVTFTPPTTGAETATITATSTEDATKTATASFAVTVPGSAPSCGNLTLGSLGSLNGFVPFPSSNAWNTDISAAALDPNSNAIMTGTEMTGNHLHPDFSNIADGGYGIPYVVVDSSTTPSVPISVNAYASQSDVANAPFSATTPIEGAPGNCATGGDQHSIVIDRNRCMIYETFSTSLCNGTFSADSETIWDMKNYDSRPYGWTSADAAGLPIFPGLVRYDEVASGVINHAIRFTMNNSRSNPNDGYFVQPATHAAGTSSTSQMVMGMRIRLKASFDISSYSAANQVILTAMKKYGMILADNGSDLFFQGTPDARWNDDDLNNLKNIDASNFEVVQMTPTYPGWDATTAPTGATPTINSFTASSSTVAAGTAVTFTWNTTNDTYDFIDKIGGVSNGTVTVTPTATTTYTLNATNHYGRTTKSVTVVVQ